MDEYIISLCDYGKPYITKQDGKRKLNDTFINAVYAYDDHFKIIYKNKEEAVSLEALENSSPLFSSIEPKHLNPNILPISEMFGFVVFFAFIEF